MVIDADTEPLYIPVPGGDVPPAPHQNLFYEKLCH